MTRRYLSRRTLSVMLAALTLWVTAAVPEEEHGDPGDEHGAGHEDEMPEVVHFTAVQRQALGIATTAAGPGPVTVEVRLVGEVGLNLDRTAHVTSRVPGVVVHIARSFGERVEAGETLAVLDSLHAALRRPGGGGRFRRVPLLGRRPLRHRGGPARYRGLGPDLLGRRPLHPK